MEAMSVNVIAWCFTYTFKKNSTYDSVLPEVWLEFFIRLIWDKELSSWRPTTLLHMSWHVVWEILQDTGPKPVVYKEEKQEDVLIVLQLKVTVSSTRIPFARNSLLSVVLHLQEWDPLLTVWQCFTEVTSHKLSKRNDDLLEGLCTVFKW